VTAGERITELAARITDLRDTYYRGEPRAPTPTSTA